MQQKDLVAALRSHPFDKNFTSDQVERLASLAREVSFDRDQVIFREGGESHDFHLIIGGRVALEIEVPNHPNVRVQTLSGGDELGWSAVLMGQGKYFQARALEPVKALAFDGEALLAACKADPAFGFAFIYRVLELVSERLQATRLQVLDHYSPIAKRAGA
jgi:CRP-like cAMP-binding protein